MQFIPSYPGTQNDEWVDYFASNGFCFGTNCLVSASEDEVEMLEKGYLILDDDAKYTVQVSPTGVSTSDYDTSGNYPNDFTFQIKFNDSVSQTLAQKVWPGNNRIYDLYTFYHNQGSNTVNDICFTLTSNTEKNNP